VLQEHEFDALLERVPRVGDRALVIGDAYSKWQIKKLEKVRPQTPTWHQIMESVDGRVDKNGKYHHPWWAQHVVTIKEIQGTDLIGAIAHTDYGNCPLYCLRVFGGGQ
jgi:hypothetical protein